MVKKSPGSKKTKPTKSVTAATKVTRIKASDSKSAKKTPETKKALVKTAKSEEQSNQKVEKTKKRSNPFAAIWGYFKGSWYELRQVRWPDRRATWGMTVALILFTAFFVLVILLLDAFFKYIFQIILG